MSAPARLWLRAGASRFRGESFSDPRLSRHAGVDGGADGVEDGRSDSSPNDQFEPNRKIFHCSSFQKVKQADTTAAVARAPAVAIKRFEKETAG
jgi:hypothetical protein